MRKLVVIMIVIALVDCSATRPTVEHVPVVKERKTAGTNFNPVAVSHFIRGVMYDYRTDHKSALLEFNEALLFDSSSATIYNKIAEQYIKLKKFDHAEKVLTKAVRKHPDSVDSYRMLAAIYYHQGNWKKTEHAYLKILELQPDDMEIRFNLVHVYMGQGEKMKVADMYEEIIKRGGGTPDIELRVANIYLENKKFNLAKKSFEQYYQRYPDDERAYLGLAKLSLAQLDTAKAIEWYHNGVQHNSAFMTCLEELRDIYIKQQDWNAAITLIKSTIEKDSSNIELQLRLGELYYNKKDTTEAFNIFNSTIQNNPDDFRAYYSVGALFYQQQQWEESAPYFKKVIKLKPEFVRSWLMLGLVYLRTDQLDSAETHFLSALETDPENVDFNYFLGTIYSRQHKMEKAVPYLEKSLAGEPENIEAISALAAAYDELKMHAKSDSLYEIALKIRADDALIMNNYSYSLSVRGERLDQALEMSQKAVARDSSNGAYLDTLGWIYFKLGNYPKALKYIKMSTEKRGLSAEVFEHLGDVYEKLNDIENARRSWQEAYKLDSTRSWLLEKIGEQ